MCVVIRERKETAGRYRTHTESDVCDGLIRKQEEQKEKKQKQKQKKRVMLACSRHMNAYTEKIR